MKDFQKQNKTIKILLHFAKKPADEDASLDIAKSIHTCHVQVNSTGHTFIRL